MLKTKSQMILRIAELSEENNKYKQTLADIRTHWNRFIKMSPLEIAFNQKDVYELDKTIKGIEQ